MTAELSPEGQQDVDAMNARVYAMTEAEREQWYRDHQVSSYAAPASATPDACPECGAPVSEHVGRKACLPAVSNNAKNLWDLPVFGWAWKEDGRDRRA